jgi:alkyl sulfatase BDS1-like metallo-beta-lactamase superfamily hydrolase
VEAWSWSSAPAATADNAYHATLSQVLGGWYDGEPSGLRPDPPVDGSKLRVMGIAAVAEALGGEAGDIVDEAGQ